MDIYIARGEDRKGPYQEDSIRQYLADGQLDGTELAWHEDLEGWVNVNTVIHKINLGEGTNAENKPGCKVCLPVEGVVQGRRTGTSYNLSDCLNLVFEVDGCGQDAIFQSDSPVYAGYQHYGKFAGYRAINEIAYQGTRIYRCPDCGKLWITQWWESLDSKHFMDEWGFIAQEMMAITEQELERVKNASSSSPLPHGVFRGNRPRFDLHELKWDESKVE